VSRYFRLVFVALISGFLAACGGTKANNPAPAVSISISPTTATVDTGQTQQFTATVSNASDTSVTWSLSGDASSGTISASGLYTAPATLPDPATVTVTATSVADSTKSASATITLTDIQVSVSPATANVSTGMTQQFTATVTGTTTTTVTWSVNDVAGGDDTVGTIDADGLYTAPATLPDPATVTVKAASTVNTNKSGSATVTVVSGGLTVSGTATKGPVNGATVTVYDVNADGTNGSTLGTGTTDSSGNFTVALSSLPAGPIRVVVSGGTYTSEVDSTTVTCTSSLSALVDSVTENVTGLAVTPLTDLVNSLTVYGIQSAAALRRGHAAVANSTTTAHAAANSTLAAFYGLSSGAKVETTHPKFGQSDITGDPDGFKAGLAIGTLGLLGKEIQPSSPDDILGAISADLSDGKFDGRDASGPIHLGGSSGPTLPPTAATTDFLTALNAYVETADAIVDNGITPDEVSGKVTEIAGGVTSSPLTPPAVGLSAGSSGAVGTMSFGGHQYVFIAARSNGVAVIDVTDPAAPTAKTWASVYSTTFSNTDVGGVIPVVGTADHPQVLAFAYNSKHWALLNAQMLATGTPGTDDPVDVEGDLPLAATSPVSFSGGSAYIAGGIPDNGRKGVWLATADGYYFFDLTSNSLTTLYPIDSTNFLAENIGGDIAHNLLLAGNYGAYNGAAQLVDLLAGKSYYMDPTYYTNNIQPLGYIIDGNAVDSGLQVGIFTFEDTNTAAFVNLATITKTDSTTPGVLDSFVPASDNGFAGLTFDNTQYPVFSGSAVDSSSHLALFMAGYSTSMGVGQLQDPASAASGAWTGLTDWGTFNLTNSTALGGYCSAADPHAVGVVYNLAAGKPFGYLLDGCTARAIQIDMSGFLALPRAGTTGDAAHELATGTDPAASGGPVTAIPLM
jgi:hypothetical protein